MAEKERGSGETERKLEGGEQQGGANAAKAPQQQQEGKGGGLHPSIYIG